MALWRMARVEVLPISLDSGSKEVAILMREETANTFIGVQMSILNADMADPALFEGAVCNNLPPACFPNDLTGCS